MTEAVHYANIDIAVVDAPIFWDKVNKDGAWMPGMDTQCWEWTAGLDYDGYGRSQRNTRAHLVSLMIHLGRHIPMQYQCRHRCHNRKCVRPDHLSVGTSKEDGADRSARGTAGSGSRPCKFSDALIEEAKTMRRGGTTLREVAGKCGMTIRYLKKLMRGDFRRKPRRPICPATR